MGRHSTGKNNYSLSKGLIALISAVVLLVVAGAAWLLLRDSGSGDGGDAASGDQAQCVAGDLPLPVAAASTSIGEKFVSDYAASTPVVRDYCVKPELVGDLTTAAVYIAPQSPITDKELAAAGRSASTNEPPAVYATPVGVAVAAGGSTSDSPALPSILFPTGEQPEASVIAARHFAGTQEEAVDALNSQRVSTTADAASHQDKAVATAEDAAPEGRTFTPIDGAELVYSAIPLTTTDTVSEEQTRAAQAFAEEAGQAFLDSHGEVKGRTEVGDQVWAAAAPAGGVRVKDPAPADAPAPNSDAVAVGEPVDTLFLLDTSAAMSAYNDAAAAAIDGAVGELTSAGRSVALWNYSSPLSPGATKGYRANVAFTTDADALIGTAARFLNDGQPLTREAVSAAVDYAESEADADAPVRIVLITSGTDDPDNDYPEQALAAAQERGVTLSIVNAGGGGSDPALARAAEFTADAASAEALGPAIRAAAGLK